MSTVITDARELDRWDVPLAEAAVAREMISKFADTYREDSISYDERLRLAGAAENAILSIGRKLVREELRAQARSRA